MNTGSSHVEEVQGLYGPFQFPELLLQRIWSDHAFNLSGLRTEQGERLRIVRSGRWNRQGGPDFREAEIKIDGRVCRGDIEIHLREPDWAAHQHAADPAFGDVILHAVLFPSQRKTSAGVGGTRIPILVLLPHLWHDLEEYAADAAVSSIAQRPADSLARGWKELTAVESRDNGLRSSVGRRPAITPRWKSWATGSIARRCWRLRPSGRSSGGSAQIWI